MELHMYEEKIVENTQITKNVFLMKIDCAAAAAKVQPGQFVNLYTGRADLLLPRPISIFSAADGLLQLAYAVVGKGTAHFAEMKAGATIRFTDPLGKGFRTDEVREGDTAILLGGGLGVAPLFQLARVLKGKGANIICLAGAEEKPYFTEEWEALGVTYKTILNNPPGGGRRGTVMDLLIEEESAAKPVAKTHNYACGPVNMLKALALHYAARSEDIQVSMEERMGCGYGACVGCVCETKKGRKKVCSKGPVFLGSEVRWDAE